MRFILPIINNVIGNIRNIAESLSFPGRCYSCEEEWEQKIDFICNNCWASLQKAPRAFTKKYLNLGIPVTIIYSYTSLMRDIVHQMKFLGRKDIAKRLGNLSGGLFKRQMFGKNFDAIVPVPLHPTRVRERGFDQNLTIADAFSGQFGVKVANELIIRTKNTRPQSRLSDSERTSNLKNAFAVKYGIHSPKPESVLLIDDVIHSGATVIGCVKALNDINISNIHIVTVCG